LQRCADYIFALLLLSDASVHQGICKHTSEPLWASLITNSEVVIHSATCCACVANWLQTGPGAHDPAAQAQFEDL